MAVTFARKMWINWLTRKRQASEVNGGPDPVENLVFYKYERIPFEIVLVEPSGAEFERINITSLACKIMVNDTLDDASPLAEVSLTKNTDTMVFSGTLALDTAGMTSYIGSASKTPYFEIQVTDGTNFVKVLSTTCTINVPLGQSVTVSPDPSRQYLDYNETLGVFVPRSMAPGESISIPSPNNLYRRILGCNDDGTRRDDIEEL